MCGRYALLSSTDLLVELFALSGAVPPLEPRYNIAPTQTAPVVRATPERSLDLLRWGLIPSWARDAGIGARMINARSETAAEKPAFREALARRRCLVPADGFFEWQKRGRGKQPYFIRRRDGAPCALAGLWERWSGASAEEPIESYTILTTAPNTLVAPLHDRMPVIIEPADFEPWLDPDEHDARAIRGLLRPLPSERMEAYPVSRRVNRPANDDSSCIEPLTTVAGDDGGEPPEPSLFDW